MNFKKLGQGKPVIILHGFLGTLDNWMSVGKALSENYEIYLVDQRNHGLSPKSDTFSYDDMAADLMQFIEDQKLKDPVLIGHSMGGKTIMQFSAKHPDTFSKMIMVDIAPKYYPVHHQDILDGLLSIDIKNLTERSEADEQLSKFVKERGIRQFLLKNLDREKEGFTWKANLEVLNRDIEKLGQEINGKNLTKKPVFFIAGEKSDYIKKEDREKIKEMYPNAQTLNIKDAGHWVHAEQQEAFLKTIKYLLDN